MTNRAAADSDNIFATGILMKLGVESNYPVEFGRWNVGTIGEPVNRFLLYISDFILYLLIIITCSYLCMSESNNVL